MNVLLIDDDPCLLRALTRNLISVHRVTTATRACDAIVLLTSTHFDVILCDRQMPEMSGTEFVAKLSADEAARVVFMTGGEAVPHDELTSPHLTLLKPFTKKALLASIEGIEPAPLVAA